MSETTELKIGDLIIYKLVGEITLGRIIENKDFADFGGIACKDLETVVGNTSDFDENWNIISVIRDSAEKIEILHNFGKVTKKIAKSKGSMYFV